MPTLGKCSYIIDNEHLSAKENMHIDKELFYSFKKGDETLLRLYTWEECFTYGVSQDIEKLDFRYGKSYAKRITGGGILLHGHDVSYCIITSTDSLKNMSVKKSYEYLCDFLMRFYKKVGLKPSFAKDLDSITLKKSCYCQVGFEPYDIIVDNKKIGGNAQKRARDKLLQHGSIPLKKIEYPFGGYSLEDFGVNLSEKEAIKMLLEAFKESYGEVR